MPPKKKSEPTDDRTTFSATQKTVGRRVDQVVKETVKLESLGRVRLRCIDSKGGFDGMRIIHEGEVFDFPVSLLKTRDNQQKDEAKYAGVAEFEAAMAEIRYIEVEGVEYVVPKWCEPAPEEDGEYLLGHSGVHGNAGNAIA